MRELFSNKTKERNFAFTWNSVFPAHSFFSIFSQTQAIEPCMKIIHNLCISIYLPDIDFCLIKIM